jgi:hypothetical protein
MGTSNQLRYHAKAGRARQKIEESKKLGKIGC